MQNLSELMKRLIEEDVEFVLVGGFAAVAHGAALVTRDLDICCRFDNENLTRIQKAFGNLHPVHRMRPDLPLDLTEDQRVGLKNLYIQTDLGVVDCLGNVLGVGDYDEVRKHSVPISLPWGACRILDLDTLILAKQAMGRPHDQITVTHLTEIKKRQTNT